MLRKSLSLLLPWFAIASSSLAMSGNPTLVLGTLSVYIIASVVSLSPRNMALHSTLVSLSPLAVLFNMPIAVVGALLVLSAVITLRLTPGSLPKSCSPQCLTPRFDVVWFTLWIPQLAIGLITYGLQQHQTFAEVFWVLALAGYRHEPWILGLTCLLLIIIGVTKNPERRFSQ